MPELVGKTLKVTEDLLKKINAIQEEFNLQGLPVNDMVQKMVDLYYIEKIKTEVPSIALELETLQKLIHQIFNMYFNLGSNIDISLKTQSADFSKLMATKELNIVQLTTELKNSEEEYSLLQDTYNNLSEENDKTDIRLKEILSTVNDKQELIDEYKQKVDNLSGLIQEYKGYRAEYNLAASKLIDKEKEVADLTLLLHEKASIILFNQKEAAAKEQHLIKDIEDLKMIQKSNLIVIEEKAMLIKNQEVLGLKILHQEKIEEQRQVFLIETEKNNSKFELLTAKYDKARDLIEKLQDESRILREVSVKKI